ncbi:MAG: hypothetical protein ACOYJ1_01580 [Peptococcales bacterium]|jgi:hypothetical protein
MKIYKQTLYFLLIITCMFFFVACNDGAKLEDNKSNDKGASTQADSVVEKEETAGEDNEKDVETKVEQKTNQRVNLPEGYPIDFVPIMDDATSGSGINTDGNFNISYGTPSSGEQVMEFYTSHFQKYGDAVIIADNNLEINLEADGKGIQILLDTTGTSTYVRISIHNLQAPGGNDVNGDFTEKEEKTEMTQEFPTDIVPIIDGAEIIDQSSEEEGNGTEYSITFSVNKSFKDVTEFYKKIVNKMSDSNITEDDFEFYAGAVKSNHSVEIQITDNGDSSFVLINIYPK